jgi:hypothetical protein
MNHRRVIGSLLALALLAGSVFVPLARAACAIPKAERASSCPSCSSTPVSGETSVSADRSCCAAPPSLSDRDPATLGTDRGDHRSSDASPLLSEAAAAGVPASSTALRLLPARVPGSSPPLLRSTVLRI